MVKMVWLEISGHQQSVRYENCRGKEPVLPLRVAADFLKNFLSLFDVSCLLIFVMV